ncbi:toMV resistant protein Tm-2 netted virescent-like [Gossypium raimondii]|uniref:toMV resistant protein Tm-2 netted virescent-like n=1 Tax=Gossypium raimondii TaxID=29730 RepID=UPI00227C80BA|nr:toMV resistant protein Tm-2 netted virescent-like [Gossypium raimondii]
MNALINILKKKIGQAKRGKEQIKYLLVLDDVWSVEKWDELKNHLMGINKNGGNGVIVTTRSNSGSSGYNSEEVMEGLKTHTNLQSLAVSNYQGESFPSWMLKPVGDSNTGLFLLNILIELKFS